MVCVSIAAAAVLVFHATLPEDDLDIVPPGALTVATEAEGSWTLDELRVELDADSLTIRDGDLVLWSSQPGRAFVTGARGAVDWTEHKGYFWPEVEIAQRLPDQRVDGVTAASDRVVLSGSVVGDGDPAPYTLSVTVRARGGAVVELVTQGELDAVGWVSGRSSGAAVHGFGEQFTDFDLDGRLVPIVAREQGIGRGKQPLTFLADLTNHGAGGTDAMTYAAWSSFVTEDVRGVRLDPAQDSSHAFAVADLRDPDRVGLEGVGTAAHCRARRGRDAA